MQDRSGQVQQLELSTVPSQPGMHNLGQGQISSSHALHPTQQTSSGHQSSKHQKSAQAKFPQNSINRSYLRQMSTKKAHSRQQNQNIQHQLAKQQDTYQLNQPGMDSANNSNEMACSNAGYSIHYSSSQTQLQQFGSQKMFFETNDHPSSGQRKIEGGPQGGAAS